MMKFLHIALLFCSVYAAASACEDGTKAVVEGTRCRKYAECQKGSWYLKDCQFGQIFDHKTLRCTPVTELRRCYDVTRCSEGRVYSYMGKSNLYYRCIKGRISVHVCGEGEIFDPELESCSLDHALRLKASNMKEVGACKEGSKHRDGKACKDYIECVNGEEVKKTCSQCQNFDDNTQTCRFVFLTPCGDTPTPKPPTPAPTTATTTTTTTTTTQKPDPTPTPDTPTTPPTQTTPPTSTTPPTPTVGPCKNGEKEGIVDPNCKAYRECKNGEWVQDACGWFRKFDAIKKDCYFTWWNTITCAK